MSILAVGPSLADLREAESLQDNGDLAWLQDG
jgi:hypothetical protein